MKAGFMTSGVSAILHSLVLPVFTLVFIAFYRPYGIYDALQMENVSFTFNLTIFSSIILLSVTITRVWLYLIGKFKRVSRPVYAVWCLGEIVVTTLFLSLYMTLITPGSTPFFDMVGFLFVVMLSTAVFPYGFLWLGMELYAKNHEEQPSADDSGLVRFYDEYHKLRLVIASEALLFIKSEENYVQIHYMDQDRSRKFILRSSMRALESVLTKHGLIRCHRSYFINPAFIKIVHRDTAGLIVAELKVDGYDSIPISRKYHDEVSKLL